MYAIFLPDFVASAKAWNWGWYGWSFTSPESIAWVASVLHSFLIIPLSFAEWILVSSMLPSLPTRCVWK